MACELYKYSDEVPEYFSKRKDFNLDLLKKSTCLYIGNLSYFTTELQIFELFSKCGEIKRIIMGLNKNTKTPCGFCFVEYNLKSSANIAVTSLNNTILDGRQIRVDWDTGFEEGRQFGRGRSGAQKRDDMSKKSDPERPFQKSSNFSQRKRSRDRDYNYYH